MSFTPKRFRNPPLSFRGAPFWALNNDLTNQDRLREQIDAFSAMGMGGFHLHVRGGLKTPYLGKDFLDAIVTARNYAEEKGMLCYLYDEDKWPSGFAGGAITRELTYRTRYAELRKGRPAVKRNDYREPLCAYRINLDADGYIISSQRVPFDEAGDEDWILTRCICENNPWYNGAAYLDVLNPEAVDAFIASTHAVYYKLFGNKFPENVPAIFTDEPQMKVSSPLPQPDSGVALIPWTDDLPTSFKQATNENLLDLIPKIIWPLSDGPSHWRWTFHDFLSERFATTFTGRLGQWCEKHGIALSGHMLNEDTLGQIQNLGECMRHYPNFQLPGIDLLCDRYKPCTAKQVASVARQQGKTLVLSELYGVTNWDFTFAGHKHQGDWQAALGINLRVHHLAWLSMEGIRKRDYPAAIGPQSPWFKEYPVIEDHFSRVGTALAEGTPLVRVGVIHPVESAWLHRGVNSLDNPEFHRRDKNFLETTDWLLNNGFDFDYIAESLLPELEETTEDPVLRVGKMAYHAILLPDLETIRKSTLESLQRFLKRGGTVIVMGKPPTRLDGIPSDVPGDALKEAITIEMTECSLSRVLEPWREVKFVRASGTPMRTINHQLRKLGNERILFCSNRELSNRSTRPWIPITHDAAIWIKGSWQVVDLDTNTGESKKCSYEIHEEWTIVPWDAQPHSHRLLHLTPGERSYTQPVCSWSAISDCPEPHCVKLEEPNVLLLDMAEWRVDDGPWQVPKDSLLIQHALVERYRWTQSTQPYAIEDVGTTHRVSRRFKIDCAESIKAPKLVCERMREADIILDGHHLDNNPDGWWVDHDLPTLNLPDLKPGIHTLEICLELNAKENNLEWCYLLGKFEVQTRGAHAKLISPKEPIVWGDCVPQGLPFYGGNIDYRIELNIDVQGNYAIRCPSFGGPLLHLWCNDKDCGPVAFSPYRVELGHLNPGRCEILMRSYGNRHNSFGALHNNRPAWEWWGPEAWLGENEERNDAWQFKPTGILRAPILEKLL